MVKETLGTELVREFVIAAHGDFPNVKRLLASFPALLQARDLEWDESGLDAAGHMGHREIAGYLLELGAEKTLFSAAMLGDRMYVKSRLEAEPALANANGVHGISLLFHAALSGDVELVEELRRGGNIQSLDDSLHAAVSHGHREMAAWLIAHGADLDVKDFAGRTPWEVAELRGDTTLVELFSQAT